MNLIPKALRNIPSWLVWKRVQRTNADGKTVLLKVPYYTTGSKRRGTLGSPADRRRLTTYERACEVLEGGEYDGLGFAPMPEYELTILDLDKCISSHGEYSEFATAVMESGTYVERSPSGRGLRAIYTGGAVVQGKRNGHIATGERVEIYCGNAFVTITGDRVAGSRATDLPEELHERLAPVITGAVDTAPDATGMVSPDAAPIPEFLPAHARVVLDKLPETWGQPGHGSWYKVAAALHLQFDGSDEGYDLLDAWSQGLDGYDPDNNRKRWDAGFNHTHGSLTTMRNLVFEAVNNGGLRVRKETMVKWGLARPAVDDFEVGTGDDDSPAEATLPDFTELDRLANIGALLTEVPPPVDWLIENFVARRNVTMLAGGSGTSKSFLAMEMLMSAAAGVTSFGGMAFARPLRTLYLAYEDSIEVMHGRIESLRKYIDEKVDIIGDNEYIKDLSKNFFMLTSEVLDSGAWTLAEQPKKYGRLEITKLAPYLRDYISARGIDVLVLDTGSETHAGKEEDSADMVVLSRAMRQIATSTGCGVLVLQHVQKAIWGNRLAEINQSNVRGSGVIVDKVRNVVMMARMPRADATMFGLPDTPETHEDYVVLKHVKANLGSYVPLTIFERSHNGVLVHRPDIREIDMSEMPAPVAPTPTTSKQAAKQQENEANRELVFTFIQAENADGAKPTKQRIMGMCELTDNVATAILRKLLGDGRIVNDGTRNASEYRVVTEQTGDEVGDI